MQRSSGNVLGTIRFQDSKLQDLGTTVDMSPSHTRATLQQRDMTSSTAVDVDATCHASDEGPGVPPQRLAPGRSAAG